MSFIHPDDSDNLRAAVTTSMEQGKSLDIEYKIITNKGYTRVAHALGEVIKNDDGHPLYMFGTIQDITERKHSEETLRKLFRALEQSPNAVFITDLQGTIEYINPKFTEITGYTQEESLGQNPRILKSEKTSKELYNNLWRTIRRGEEWKSEIMDKRKDGSHFWAYETIAPVKDDHGLVTHYIATHEDISERKDSEFAIKTALEHADIANRAKSELLANMSHELRTPLNAIIGFSGAIKMEAYGPIGNDKYRDYVSDIASSGQHLLELINDILDVSAIEAGMVELQEGDIEIPNIVESSIRLVKHRAEQGEIELNINVDDSLPMLHADERRIKQILLNLLSNAIKFTQPGGEVSLNATLDENNGHVFTVSDTGIGMNNNEQAKAMKQFSQVDSGLNRTQEGTGLGLPLTLGLVELHGGTLDIDSTKDEGTRVTVRFSQERTIVS